MDLHNFTLPQRLLSDGERSIDGPGHESFTKRFGDAFPKPIFLRSDLGSTALYNLKPLSGQAGRNVLIVHGLNTPALGMLPLARKLQSLDPNVHIVLFDLCGHGLSATPLVAHTPSIFHSQMLQILSYMKWTEAHIMGYSFGGSITISFAVYYPWAVSSAVVLAPAGVLQFDSFSERMRELLENSHGQEEEAIDCVLEFLEGGPLVVPEDWEEKSMAGWVIAPALRKWELEEHRGFRHSALSMFRSAVYGCEDIFRAFGNLHVNKMTVLAELDFVCSQTQLKDLGIENVIVVKNADHGFVRENVDEVAAIVHALWKE